MPYKNLFTITRLYVYCGGMNAKGIAISRILEFDAAHQIVKVGKQAYGVFEDGRVWSFSVGRFLTPDIDKDGYRIVTVGRRKVKLHRLICAVFNGGMQNLQVRHLDGDPSNNHVSNLLWGTPEENWKDRLRHKRGIGEDHGSVKLTKEQVIEIRNHLPHKGFVGALAEKYQVSKDLIYKVRNKSVWRHL